MMSCGSVFWILMAIAFVALVMFLNRLGALRRARIDGQDFLKGVDNVLAAGNVDEALAICEDLGVPLAGVASVAIRHRTVDAQQLREAVDARGRAEIGRFSRRIGTLAILGQVAPLLGLLGAVLGFMRVVQAVNAGDVVSRVALLDAAMRALMPAAAGLAVAILIAVMHGILRMRLDRFVVELEAGASQILCLILSHRGDAEA